MATVRTRRVGPIRYPESDGKPMAESDLHVRELMRAFQTLDDAFAARAEVYVGANMLLYYEEGNPRASVAPDVFVVIGVPKLPLRRIYKVWEEGVPPSFALEITSASTRREDLRKKWNLYAQMGVREYVLYDPEGEYLRPPLQGHRLVGGTYEPMETDADGALLSDMLGMRLLLVNGRLRFVDRRTGAPLLSPAERADREAEARRMLEARVAELEARLRESRQHPETDGHR